MFNEWFFIFRVKPIDKVGLLVYGLNTLSL